MSVEKTEIKVTKIEKSPSKYYSPQKTQPTAQDAAMNIKKEETEAPRITEWVKVGAVASEEKKETFLDKVTPRLQAAGKIALGVLAFGAQKARRAAAAVCRKGLYLATEHTKKLAISGAASVLLGVVLVSVVCGTCSVACRIKLGDKEIGTLPNEQVYYEILSDVKEELLDTAAVDFEPSGELSVSKVLVGKGQFSEPNDVKERLKSTSSEMIPAWGVAIDDKTVVALAAQQDALDLLEEYKQQFAEEGAFLSFHSRVEVSRQFVPVQILKSREDALAFLNSGEEPVLLVRSTVECAGEEEIPFETEEQPDASKYIGDNTVVQEGIAGKRYIKYYSVKINGVESERTVLAEEVLRQPIKKIERVGTKELPSPIGTGEFAQPTSGTLTSTYGERWNRAHCGIDIGASTGTMIYASDNGTVTYSQYNNGGYGKLVKIDHGNGYVTYYGHCSELLVEAGEVVAKGDAIAKVGSTGRSTGPHLHFEVRKNGEPQNPLQYLNRE